MTVYAFGNPDLAEDSLPVRIAPRLQEKFPEARFEVKDPNEEWDAPEELIVIDTVAGIPDVQIFDSLESFSAPPRLTMHDFDAYANLRLLQKLGTVKKITIIGVPPGIPEENAISKISVILKPLSKTPPPAGK